jgi:hypothetical protein
LHHLVKPRKLEGVAIALEFRDNIQFVILEGNLSKVEEAALRLKLDQKFSQGRTLLIIKLDRFNFDSPESITVIGEMIGYFVSLGAWIGISGLNNKQMSQIQGLYKPQCKGFSTEQEAKKWIAEESQKPKDNAPKKITEDDIKRTEINLLIQSYATSFIDKDQDTFRIAKLAHEYSAVPSADFLQAIRNMLVEKDRLEIEIQKREAELDQIEKVLLDFMKFRKLPATEAEILSHMKLSEAKSTETDSTLRDINDQITKLNDRLQNAKKQSETHHENWKKRLEEGERDLKTLKSQNERAETEMKRREKEETAEIEKLRQGATK